MIELMLLGGALVAVGLYASYLSKQIGRREEAIARLLANLAEEKGASGVSLDMDTGEAKFYKWDDNGELIELEGPDDDL